MVTNLRKHTRLNIEHGIVFLRYASEPAAACVLKNLSEDGCEAELRFLSVDPRTADLWKTLLTQDLEVDADICRLPWIFHFHVKARVSRLLSQENSVLIGLQFVQNDETRQVLRQSLLSLAVDRIHRATQVGLARPTNMEKTETEQHEAPAATKTASPEVRPARSPKSWTRRSLIEILGGRGLLKNTDVTLESLETPQDEYAFARKLLRSHTITPFDLCQALSAQSGMPIANIAQPTVPDNLKGIFSYLTMLRYEFVPYAESKEMICIAAVQPLPETIVNKLEAICKRRVIVFLAPIDQIQHLQFTLRPRGPNQERQHLRVRTCAAVCFQYCDEHGVNLDNDVHHGHTVDMSDAGFQIITPVDARHIPADLISQKRCLRVEIECQPTALHAICRIRHIRVVNNGSSPTPHWLIGVQISAINSGELKALRDKCVRASMDLMRNRNRGLTPD